MFDAIIQILQKIIILKLIHIKYVIFHVHHVLVVTIIVTNVHLNISKSLQTISLQNAIIQILQKIIILKLIHIKNAIVHVQHALKVLIIVKNAQLNISKSILTISRQNAIIPILKKTIISILIFNLILNVSLHVLNVQRSVINVSLV